MHPQHVSRPEGQVSTKSKKRGPHEEPAQAATLADCVIDALAEAIFITDADGRIERANQGAIEQTSLDTEELVGQPIDKLMKDRSAFRSFFGLRLSHSKTRKLNTQCVRRDGSIYVAEISADPIADPATGAAKALIVIKDISDRTRKDEESRILSAVSQGISKRAELSDLLRFVHETVRRLVFAENFYIALYEPRTERLVIEYWADKFDPPPPPMKIGNSLTAYAFKQGRPTLLLSEDVARLAASGEVSFVGTDSPVWLGVPLSTPRGVIGILVVQDYERSDTYSKRDIDLLTAIADQIAVAIERKKSEDALSRSNERFELVTRATSDAVWDWNLETNELWWNDGFRTLFGYDPSEAPSSLEKWAQLIHPDDSGRVAFNIKRAIESTTSNWQEEYRFRRNDGTFAHVSDRGYVVRDANGKSTRMLGSMMDITQRKVLEEQLTHQALHDPLTNIANRALFRDRVDHALLKASRNSQRLAVLFLDLDNFKSINDSTGHASGDRLLVAVANRLNECLRTSDTAARLGGDEFAVLVESIKSDDEATMIAERILDVFRQPFTLDGRELFVKTSIGIAISSDVDTSETLLRNADLAMYLAKGEGKGRYVVFERKMHDALVERVQMESDLRRAIRKNEFRVHYQPIFDLYDHRLIGMEALVRWIHPKLGELPPARFIPIAEETGMIVQLGELIIVEACRQVEAWRVRYGIDFPYEFSVTVNISIRQFQERDLLKVVRRALDESGLPPQLLILEITESFMMEDAETTIEKLQKLKALGIRLAIDDFGTGYSSLSYLQRFPVDILKIDKSFIDKLGHGSEGNAVAKAIIMMGDSLKLSTIAEGIETKDQIIELRALGCGAGQGFYFSKPLAAEGMEEYLLEMVEAFLTPTDSATEGITEIGQIQ